ncbi:intein-containing Rv2578c family radical SAM protein [Pseudonocardia sp. Cha107L01]|uniref:intein-containing Rv2578c family radical SAM protein n=1 Tax=Pseudonocardia sp. Cha107L01 TaxID=3457576 RepID=UPI00403E4B00
MRWGNQEVGADGVGSAAVLPGMGGYLRSVRTPEFAGMVFHEVEARSALNKVPAGAMPFGWTINPYRGCSHACTYCAVGETPVLLADGRVRALAELRVGDEIYGTERRGPYRRYVRTTVLAHWATVKTAFRVTLADGTELVTSGDHRFLTERGWKHVTGGMCGAGRRPYLTTGNSLLGTGRFAAGPTKSESYERGYLFGMIQGDGHVGSYSYERPGRGPADVHRFRLALVDGEALRRSRFYLADHGVPTDEFAFAAAKGARRPINAIRNQSRRGVETVRGLLRWPTVPDEDWIRGFLAGIFDAEGSCSRGILRISNADPDIIGWTVGALNRLGFRWVEDVVKANGVRTIRLLGGQVDRMRFFHAVDPAITRKRDTEGEAIKNDANLGVVGIEPLGLTLPMYDITTGTGDFVADGVVSHNCFARNTHTYLDLDAGEDFNRQVVVKVNVARVLEHELRSRRWGREHVAMGTNTDPYQRAEGRYRLMPGVIRALARSGTPFSVLTKGTLLARDLPLLASVSADVSVGLGVSIALADRELQASLEPGTPSPAARLELVRRLTDAGLSCGVMVAPVLPLLTDSTEALDELLGQIASAGASGATVLALHLRPGTREWFLGWLAKSYPGLLEPYRRLYARGAYVDRRYREALGARVGPLLRRHGLARPGASGGMPGDGAASFPSGVIGPGPTTGGGEQLALL